MRPRFGLLFYPPVGFLNKCSFARRPNVYNEPGSRRRLSQSVQHCASSRDMAVGEEGAAEQRMPPVAAVRLRSLRRRPTT